MKLINTMLLAFLVYSLGNTHPASLVTGLEEIFDETSGLIYIDEKILSINDEGEPAIHEIDSLTGKVTRSVVISNATVMDWEDIAYDEEYIYVGDFGNNYGRRKDLKIYKVSREDYFNTVNDTVTAEVINFSYADQSDFSKALFTTNFDAEALIAYGDSLYVFTKNWSDKKSNIYAIPKIPGTYEVEIIDSLQVGGLITGADFDRESGKILLSGNSIPHPFIVELSNFSSGLFSNGTVNKYSVQVPKGYSIQVEGISFKDENSYFLTAEKNAAGKAGLYEITSTNATM